MEHPLSGFYRNRAAKDGLNAKCKSCVKAHYEANRARNAEAHRKWHAKNAERISRLKREYHQRMRDDPKYRARRRAHKVKRKKLLAGAKSAPYVRGEIFERDHWVCHLCQKLIQRELDVSDSMAATIDHVVPLSRGGDDTPENVKAAHGVCNFRKRDRNARKGARWVAKMAHVGRR